MSIAVFTFLADSITLIGLLVGVIGLLKLTGNLKKIAQNTTNIPRSLYVGVILMGFGAVTKCVIWIARWLNC